MKHVTRQWRPDWRGPDWGPRGYFRPPRFCAGVQPAL